MEKGSQKHDDVVFRVVLFNLFTRIETYQTLERELGPLTWAGYRDHREKFDVVLRDIEKSGEAMYTGAFQKPAPKLGKGSNWENHLHLLDVLMRKDPNLVYAIKNCEFLVDVYDWINCLPGMETLRRTSCYWISPTPDWEGRAWRGSIHRIFVVAGVGAVKGIELCFNGPRQGHGNRHHAVDVREPREDVQTARPHVRRLESARPTAADASLRHRAYPVRSVQVREAGAVRGGDEGHRYGREVTEVRA